jgi:hypothetical protein
LDVGDEPHSDRQRVAAAALALPTGGGLRQLGDNAKWDKRSWDPAVRESGARRREDGDVGLESALSPMGRGVVSPLPWAACVSVALSTSP